MSISKYIKNINKSLINEILYKKFKINFSNLHNKTKNISNKFEYYTIFLLKIYKFIIKNLDNITIKVDETNIYMDVYLEKILKSLDMNLSLSFVDFGGGQGVFLNYICNKINTNNCWVIEKKNTEFVYSTNIIENKTNIKYLLWNNKKININSNSIDCCCAIQVLHHINDKIINKILKEFYRILKIGGIVFLVEHDYNNELHTNIDSDHHLYYIMNDQIRLLKNKTLLTTENCINNFQNYVDNYYSNYKSQTEWDKLFMKHSFVRNGIISSKNSYNGKYYCIYKKIKKHKSKK